MLWNNWNHLRCRVQTQEAVLPANIQTASLLFNYPKKAPPIFQVLNFVRLNDQTRMKGTHEKNSTLPQTDTNFDITAVQMTNASSQFLRKAAGKQAQVKHLKLHRPNTSFSALPFSIFVSSESCVRPWSWKRCYLVTGAEYASWYSSTNLFLNTSKATSLNCSKIIYSSDLGVPAGGLPLPGRNGRLTVATVPGGTRKDKRPDSIAEFLRCPQSHLEQCYSKCAPDPSRETENHLRTLGHLHSTLTLQSRKPELFLFFVFSSYNSDEG